MGLNDSHTGKRLIAQATRTYGTFVQGTGYMLEVLETKGPRAKVRVVDTGQEWDVHMSDFTVLAVQGYVTPRKGQGRLL